DAIPTPPQDSYELRLKVYQPGTFQPRWTRPHTVLLVTDTAVKVSGRKAWIHVSQVKTCHSVLPTPTGMKWSRKILDSERPRTWGEIDCWGNQTLDDIT
uniref:Murine leukemia virus integrase C-terminal domain-containing protein n=1 Tax=Salmo trutta TaxID=8032 RepID=A0A673VV33_SALTR